MHGYDIILDNAQPIIWPPPSKTSEPRDPLNKKSDKVRIKDSKIPVLNVEDVDAAFDKKKRMSLCSEEVCQISDKKIEKSGDITSIYESGEDPIRPASPIPDREVSFSLVDEISKAQARSRSEERREIMSKQSYEEQSFSESKVKKTTKEQSFTTTSTTLQAGSSETKTIGGLRRSVSPEILDISSKPHEIRSLLPPASAVRPMSPMQVVVFPPEIPDAMRSRSTTPQPPAVTEVMVRYTPTPSSHITEDKVIKSVTHEQVTHSKEKKAETKKEEKVSICEKHSSKKERKQLQRIEKLAETVQLQENKKNTEKESQVAENKRVKEKMYTKSEVDKIVQEELKKALKESEIKEKTSKVKKEKMMNISELPAPIIESGKMASALSTAPDRPFTPVPFPKPLEIPSVSHKPHIKMPVSQHPVSLPPYSKPYFPPPPPPPEHEKKDENVARALREVGCRSPMTEALTTAPNRPYSPLPTLVKADLTASGDLNSFKPINDIPRNKKPITMLSALTVAPNMPFTLPGKTPIPTEQKLEDMKTARSVPSAFKPLNGSVSGVIPKTAPLNKNLPVPYIPLSQVDNKSGIDRSMIAEPGMKKEMIKGFESTTAVSDNIKYSRQAEFVCESSKTQSKIPIQAQKEVPRPVTPVKSKPVSGLHGPNLLPYYQQNIGEIPVRNRSISPVPHLIKAPSMIPTVIPPPKSPVTTSSSTKKSLNTALQLKHETCDEKSRNRYSTSTYSQKSMISSESSATTKTVTNINRTKQVFKPATPPRQLSPHWRGDYVRAVQNLSPITVRLPSPQPHPAKPVGETSQEAGAKILIKKSKRGQSPIVTYQPEVHHDSCSKSTSAKECSDGKCCGEDEGYKISESDEKSGISVYDKSLVSASKSHQQLQQSKAQQLDTSKHFQEEMVLQSRRSQQSQQVQQTQQYQQKEIHSQKYQLSSKESNRDRKLEFDTKSFSQSSMNKFNHDHHIQAHDRERFDYSSGSSKTEAVSICSNFPSSNAPSITSKFRDPNSITSSRGLCGVNPSSSGGHAGGGVSSGMPGSGKSGSVAGSTAPRRGRGVLNTSVPPGGRIPLCGHCNTQIRGPFITALGKIWCPDHFVCVNAKCRRPLQDIGFVEEADGLYCEYCFEQYLAPTCDKCNAKIKGDCLNAIGKHFHPECFRCAYCEKMFENNPFFLEDALPYCETDWNELFTTKCFSCGFPIEAGDRWVEALNNNYHSQCFNCTMCKKNLEGQSFYAKGGRPYCKNHAR